MIGCFFIIEIIGDYMFKKILSFISLLFVFSLSACTTETTSTSSSTNNSSSSTPVERTYTITWKDWDGTVLEVDTDVAKGTTPTYDGETPKRESDGHFNYTFVGWDPAILPVDGNETYYACYDEQKIAVKVKLVYTLYNPKTNNQLSSYDDELPDYFGTASTTSIYDFNSQVNLFVNPTSTYSLVGWYYKGQIVSNQKQYGFLVSTEDMTIEVRLSYAMYTLSVASNNARNGTIKINDSSTYYAGSVYADMFATESVSISAFTNNIYRFLGWYDGSKCVSTSSIYTFKMVDHNYSLVAKWDYFTITYRTNGGTNNGDNPRYYTSESSPLTLLNPTRDYYDFSCWQDSNGTQITIIDPSWLENIIVYAIWEEHIYHVTYETNGGINNPENPTEYSTLNCPDLKSPTRTGYNFIGWYTDCDFTTKITSLPRYSPSDMVLYAKWEPIVYSITYDLKEKGDSYYNEKNNPTSYTIESGVLPLCDAMPKYGYNDFVGWKYNGEFITSINPNWVSDVTIESVWKDHVFSITYVLDGGTNDPSNPESYTWTSDYKYFTFKAPTKPGCNFQGWFKEPTFKTKVDYIYTYGDMTLYAKWHTINYDITYNLNGGTNSPSNPSNYNIYSEDIVFENPVREGYTFLGWYDNDNQQITSVPNGSTGHLDLFAHWNDGNEYSVSLEPNGGSVSKTSIDVQFDHEYNLPTPTRVGYTFDGWYDGETLVASDGIWNYTSNKTFEAHWSLIYYSINYNLNGGTNSENNPSLYTINDEVNFESPVLEGYTFTGWNSGDTPINGISQGTYGDIDVEATWSANLNNLTVQSDSIEKGTVSVISGNGYTDEEITVNATPIDDCIFMGWYHDDNLLSEDNQYSFIMPTSDYTITARFLTQAEYQEKWEKEHGVIPVIDSENNTVSYGIYPQTVVDDADLISELNSLPEPEENGWYYFNEEYYAKLEANPFYSVYKFSNGQKIVKGSEYWFKCEPIIWDILSNEGDAYDLFSRVCLDARQFHSSIDNRVIDGKNVCPSNYIHSDVRQWLNNDFYGLAFGLNSTHVVETEIVTNMQVDIGGGFWSKDCSSIDKVYLPSRDCILNMQASDRTRMPTDWCLANYSPYAYWTRTAEDSTKIYDSHSVDSTCSICPQIKFSI